MCKAIYIGIDLAASEKRCTGLAALMDENDKLSLIVARCVYSDAEILGEVEKMYRSVDRIVIAIDAPITAEVKFREVDKKMISLGFRVMPPTFKHMRNLTIRGTKLALKLVERGVEVIETHPRSVLRSSGCNSLSELLRCFGLEFTLSIGNRHVIDAVIAAIAALCYAKGCGESVEAVDGTIWILKRMCEA